MSDEPLFDALEWIANHETEMIGLAAGTHMIVPVEPTEAMIEAAELESEIVSLNDTEAVEVWSLMLEAASRQTENATGNIGPQP